MTGQPSGLAVLPDVPTLNGPRSGATRIRIAGEAHPDRAAHVELQDFEGPLGLLLNLIEQRQMDILEVPLGELAGAYLEALSGVDSGHMPHISSFIAVAAQLILIKSRAILPRPPLVVIPIEEGPDPETALRERLLLYRRFRDAGGSLRARLEGGWQLFHREAPAAVASARAGALPDDGPPLDPAMLAAALAAIVRLTPPVAAPPEVVPRLVTLEERAAIIRAALRGAAVVVLQDLLGDTRDRIVVVVTFMAMLELVKGRQLSVEQDVPFGPIRCRAIAPA
ncbi:segregation/condensation protein A [soil metagenome]